MKWIRALLGLAVVAAFGYVVYAVKEKKVDVPFLPTAPAPVAVTEGLEVPLVLVTPLESGGSEVGRSVKFVVADDVKGPNGQTIIEQGALATGKVVKSRSGSLAGVLTNQPARLEVELDSVKAVDGKTLKLRSEKPSEPLEFTQSNTRVDESATIVDAMTDPKAREFVVDVAKQIATGEKLSDVEQAKADEQLKDLAERYGLKDTQSFLKGQGQGKKEQKQDVAGLLESVQKGDLKGLTGVDLLLAAKAAGEIIDLGSGIDKSLRGIFKGSNIHARVGLPVKTYIAEKSVVTPKKPGS